MWAVGMLASVLAAVTAGMVARIDRAHRPVAIFLAAWTVAQVVRRALADLVFAPWRELHGGAPLAGWTRAAGHLEQALFLAGLFGVAALAWHVFAAHPWPAVAAWAVVFAGCVADYPELRGERLAAVYRAATVVAVLLSVASVLARTALMSAAREIPSRDTKIGTDYSRSMHPRGIAHDRYATLATCGSGAENFRAAPLVSLILTAGLAATLAGPFIGSPFRHWWTAQVTWTVTLTVIAAIQGGALWRSRIRSVC